MKEIENKGKNRTYTEKERNEYKELFEHGEKLQLDYQMCMDSCENRKRLHQNTTDRRIGGGRRSLSRKVRPNIKRRRGTRRNIRRATRDRK